MTQKSRNLKCTNLAKNADDIVYENGSDCKVPDTLAQSVSPPTSPMYLDMNHSENNNKSSINVDSKTNNNNVENKVSFYLYHINCQMNLAFNLDIETGLSNIYENIHLRKITKC